MCIQKFSFKAVRSKNSQGVGCLHAFFLKVRKFLIKDIEILCICHLFSPSREVSNCPRGTQFNNLKIRVKHSPIPPGDPVSFGVLLITLFKVSDVWLLYTCHIFTRGQVLFGHLKIPLPSLPTDVAIACSAEVSCCGRKEGCLDIKVHWVAKLCQSISKIITTTAYSDKLFPSCKTNWLPFGNFKQCDPLL